MTDSTLLPPLQDLEDHAEFVHRHIGPSEQDIAHMLAAVGADSLDELTRQTVPAAILSREPLALPGAAARAHGAANDWPQWQRRTACCAP
jgi:glycine dehydrogenase